MVKPRASFAVLPQLGGGARLRYWPQALSPAEADRAFQQLRGEVDWQQREIVAYGRRHPQPRRIAWYGDMGYRYSGLQLEPRAWPPALQALRERVQDLTGCRFNSVLLNLYRDGRDHMGWHRDDEKMLGPEPAIASLSLGAERAFQLRRMAPKSAPVETLVLAHGSLLLMDGTTQRHCRHRLPRRRGLSEARINLTFRMILDI